MAESLGNLVTYIDTYLPNALTTANKIELINNEIKKFWTEMTSTSYYQFVTVADQPIYSMPTDMEFRMIVPNGVVVSDSTAAVSSTTIFQTYSLAGYDDTLNGRQYYEVPGGSIGLYPIPDNGYPVKIRYQVRPTISTDSTTLLNITDDYVDLIKFRVMSRIAKSGNAPDVELANNYELDARELERRMKVEDAKRDRKEARLVWSYKEGWDC